MKAGIAEGALLYLVRDHKNERTGVLELEGAGLGWRQLQRSVDSLFIA